MVLLRDCDDNEFVWATLQIVQKMRYEKDDPIYWPGDFAEMIYMIETGKIRLFAQNSFPFITYRQGETFGDSDALINEPRDSKAAAATNCVFYAIKMENWIDLLK